MEPIFVDIDEVDIDWKWEEDYYLDEDGDVEMDIAKAAVGEPGLYINEVEQSIEGNGERIDLMDVEDENESEDVDNETQVIEDLIDMFMLLHVDDTFFGRAVRDTDIAPPADEEGESLYDIMYPEEGK